MVGYDDDIGRRDPDSTATARATATHYPLPAPQQHNSSPLHTSHSQPSHKLLLKPQPPPTTHTNEQPPNLQSTDTVDNPIPHLGLPHRPLAHHRHRRAGPGVLAQFPDCDACGAAEWAESIGC